MGGKSKRHVGKPGNKFGTSRLSRKELSFRNRQRQTELSKMGLFASSKVKEPPMPTTPFEGMEQLQAVDIRSYKDILHATNSVISPAKGIENAVASVMAGMLIQVTQGVYAPGKSQYSRNERMHTREQIAVFRNSLSVLEIVFGYEDTKNPGVGRFAVKDSCYTTNFSGLFESDIWKGNGNYHLIYVKNTSNAVPSELEASEIAEAAVEKKYKDKLAPIEARITEIGDEELKKAELEMGKEIGRKVSSDREVMETIRKYHEGHPEITGTKKQYVELLIEVADLRDEASRYAEEIKSGLPGEHGIVEKIAQNSAKDGIIILESSEVDEIPGFRMLADYGDVCVYQREAGEE